MQTVPVELLSFDPATQAELDAEAAARIAAVAAVVGVVVGTQFLTGAGTYTPTAGATRALVIAVGAGGGGASNGGGTSTGAAGGGGGAAPLAAQVGQRVDRGAQTVGGFLRQEVHGAHSVIFWHHGTPCGADIAMLMSG